uniref:Uncharacterized protein n=1 Tax=Lotharella globosa TaxID=91324 RepID=A0A6U2XSC0_9EUKA|eukprot:CAMPEP_0167792930 /NCGR_PEP_ID=MMETSP0111_2-20121227/12855_1 /TAXON_ID=91324 /ORGANISM="Lotharella globosa, Strain CCCM811" /LENGTH=240 /DNA_ID=CAMNT_0007685945 /DNA_START=24 /DNA_END=746 /DNA_ORIENTATION=+
MTVKINISKFTSEAVQATPRSPPLEPREPPMRETKSTEAKVLTIFDWDDTLLPTYELLRQSITPVSNKKLSPGDRKTINAIEKQVIKLLSAAIEQSDYVCIITSAEEGWVQLSARRFYPSLLPLLSKIKILSARSTYQNYVPNSQFHWKYAAFRDATLSAFALENNIDAKKTRSIISMGDTQVERHCVRAVSRMHASLRAKSLKFMCRPSMKQLLVQLESATRNFSNVVNYGDHLDLSAA